MTPEAMYNSYYLGCLTMGEWWDALGLEELAVKRKGLSCTVEVARGHRVNDFDYNTKNFVCCRTQGLDEVTFVHSIDPVAFSVSKSSVIRLDGSLFVEGHRIRFSEVNTDPPRRPE